MSRKFAFIAVGLLGLSLSGVYFVANFTTEELEGIEETTDKMVIGGNAESISGRDLASNIRLRDATNSPSIVDGVSYGAVIEINKLSLPGTCAEASVQGKIASAGGVSTSMVFKKGSPGYIEPNADYKITPVCEGEYQVATMYTKQ